MKTIQLVFIAMLTSFGAMAQDFTYEGPARAEVRSFWTNAMGIQKTQKFAEGVAVLEAKLKEVKQKDPAYKTDKMEAEIAKWKAKTGSTSSTTPAAEDFSQLNPTQKAIKADQLLRKLFEETNIGVRPSDVPVMQFRFKEYSDMVQQYIALNTKPQEIYLKRTKTIIEKHVYQTNGDLTNIENAKASGTVPEVAERNYYLAKYNQLYWEAATKIFPEETAYADQYKTVSDFVNKMGSLESMKSAMEQNNAEKIKSRKLPAPVVVDAKLEKILIDGFNAKFGSTQKATALKAVLTQNGWTTLRHNVSGAVIGRERSAKLAYKGSDGKCYLLPDYVFIREEYIGTSFTNTKAIFNGLDGGEMLCENVK